MKVLIFTHQKPELSQSWLQNELDVLRTAKFNFLLFFLEKRKGVIQQKRYKRYFLYIPKLLQKIIERILNIIFYQIKIFISFPIKYIWVLAWILLNQPNRIFLRCFLRLTKIISKVEKFKPDIIYSHYIYDEYVFTFLTGKFLGKKYGLIPHSSCPYLPYASHLHSQAAFILVKSNNFKKDFLGKYPEVPSDKITVLPWGINTRFFKPFKEKKKSDGIFTLVFISRFVEMKGLEYLIKACRILVEKNINFKCLMVGYGPEKWKLQRYITKNRLLDYIKIKEAIPHSIKFKNILTSSDLFVLPAIVDTHGEFDFIPNAVLEAMAIEKVVVTTKVTGMQEVAKEGESIFFVKEKDPEDLAEKIKFVMKLSEEKRREIGRKGREIVVKYYDKEKQGRKFVDFLKSISKINYIKPCT